MIKEVKDIKKYARFMEDNGLKINKSEIARRLNISRKTVAKYAKGFEKKTTTLQTSIGTLSPHQTKERFYAGVSVPVNDKLMEIFFQLHISEKSGRGVPRIVGEYGEKAFDFSNNAIKVTIPYNRLNLGTPQVTPQDQKAVHGDTVESLQC